MTETASAGGHPVGPAADREARPDGLTPLPGDRQRLLEILTAGPDPLYAVLDAARDLRALNWLKESREEFQSLYDGKSAVDLEMFAPYLVRFSEASLVLRKLLGEAWGESWGVYLTCSKSLPDLRKHLRHFLMVELEGQGGKSFYFRYYDPRVLRAYLPTCTLQETKEFFGPIGSFFLEDEDQSQLLQFRPGLKGAQLQIIRLEGDDASNP